MLSINLSIKDLLLCCTMYLLQKDFKELDVQAGITCAYLPSLYIDSSASVIHITQGNSSRYTLPASLMEWVIFV